MTVEELIAKLEPIAKAAPGAVVMLGRGTEDWFDEIEEIDRCTMNRDLDGLDCGPHPSDGRGHKEVVVIH
jgi:hypothetical protein